jgi:hypothetical protein
MDGSDKKLENLKRSIASKKAKQKNVPSADSSTIKPGERRKPNPFVDINDPEANVKKYGRQFTAPKGRKGTSYSMGRKRGK